MKRSLFALAFVVLSFSANAAIQSVDLINPDDNLITRDTGTGLDWLEMSYTDGLSFSAVLAATSGGALDDWTIASESQVLDLVTNYLGRSPYAGWSSINYGILGLVDILGPTIEDNSLGSRYIFGFTIEGNNRFTIFGDYAYYDLSQIYQTGNAASSQDSGFGTFLVRDTPLIAPVPTAAWLFGSGLLGLAAMKRKRR